MTQQVFDRMCQNCVVKASDLGQYPAMIDSYPHQHLYIVSGTVGATTPLIFWCVDMLGTKGWKACHWHTDEWNVRGVVVRRT
ncbi:hypothetical protein ETD86_30850 [Nonomuraea turkmeniaca]|uniref:Uncharacterized protein n=1 Tax=Nonomuraea turkmeniaca TaxID=103838 RepID=A0A5S4F986_9ACTN|nr:hypothetical protein [Nonomuraea turkmeniaca]TMR13442.1 hypothetical protein ETD86_30850 [Nonomuraea turkmeniaca]